MAEPSPITAGHSVDVGGVRLAYDLWDGPQDAPPLVLLHALGESAADWAAVAPTLAGRHPHGGTASPTGHADRAIQGAPADAADAADRADGDDRPAGAPIVRRRVYALDLRGHGRSDWPGDYSLTLMRDDVLAFLDAVGLDRVDLVGHSMGGVVAYLLAEEARGRVRRLVLEDAPAPLPRARTVPVRPDGELPFDWDMVLAVRAEIDTPPPAWLERLDRITAPTLVLAGGPSSHVPHAGLVEMVRRVPDARLATIAVGHLIHDAAPEAFTDAVARFLAR